MGSKNYPKPGEFDEFCAKNSGSSNAVIKLFYKEKKVKIINLFEKFTDWMETNYYFDC
jgi:hypothetical protein